MASFQGQDWGTVGWENKKVAGTKKQQLQQAARKDGLDAEKKYGAGGNTQIGSTKNQLKLEEDNENLSVEKVSMELKKLLQQERQKAGLTQKDLATACSLKTNIIQDYESGKGVPNMVMIKKIERAIKQKNPEFVIGTLSKAQKTAADKAKKDAAAKAKKEASASKLGAGGAKGAAPARSRRF